MRNRLNEDGFTLIELMVVVLIIAILVAIAIPTFLGQRETAQDRAAQSNLRNALATEKTIYANDQAYTDVAADLGAVEPSLTWQEDAYAAATSNAGDVFVKLETGGVACLTVLSASGKIFMIAEDPTAATAYGEIASGGTLTDCATDATAASW
ncbi:MAG: prepilin-type N-terminal cleavage/methylation domain-containing protein [Acidimicrobiia bacterium]|nr:prepilin-type N-terminal cleavage/methylation domain-containing protein [Acidimicrobiia bacterium]MBT8250383.1 prepilin-type N-terminal cleavage/methylation domain-containing protein [Acidimicrobiia bacterium]